MNRHISILIRNVQSLDAETRRQVYVETKFKHNHCATFQIGEEAVIAVFYITEHNVERLVEHHHIQYERSIEP